VLDPGTVVIEDDRIVEVHNRASRPAVGPNDIDAAGLWVMPGLIDTHSDAIEIEIQPRPNSIMPFDVSFFELEKKLAVQGITTMYHCLAYSEIPGNLLRANDTVTQNIARLGNYTAARPLINHRVHVRYEVRNVPAAALVHDLMAQGKVHQLSFMDHTPGQGQFRDMERLKDYLIRKRSMSPQQADQYMHDKQKAEKAGLDILTGLANRAQQCGVALASHDDDTIERLDLLEQWGGRICEFPICLEVAAEAKRRGLAVVVGATNLLLGRSHSGNMSAIEAVRAGCVDILCSDYYPPALLQGVFFLKNLGFDMAWCVSLVTQNPAKALGIDAQVGSISHGKVADIAMVREHEGRPVLEKAMVAGRLILISPVRI
jgi:alpha-D-ribose 1-methylphosphonate 5-triphosphate diphosphatase